MARGEHLYVEDNLAGLPFQHHGIDMGDGTVIHLAPTEGARITLHDPSDRFSIRRVSWDEFSAGREIKIRRHANSLDPESVASTAESMLGQAGYSLLEGNCEHFATLCATGISTSHQIEMGHASLASVTSAATKAIWALVAKLSPRLAAQSLVRASAKVHPATLLADGVELVALTVSCRRGLSAARAKQVARVSGNVAAVGIGAALGGPAGAAIGLATHESSRVVADKICNAVRFVLSLRPSRSQSARVES